MRWPLALLFVPSLLSAQDSTRVFRSEHTDSVKYWYTTLRLKTDTLWDTLYLAKPDTAPTPVPVALGIPYGPFELWSTSYSYPAWGPAPFTMSITADGPDGIVTRINAARTLKHKLVLAMTSGSHTRYITDGKFDLLKWKARMDLFNTTAIKAAVAAGLTDGTILGADVMDEPQHISWGGNVSKATLDAMAAHVKGLFPGLPSGVSVRADYRPTERYKVVDFIMTQYIAYYGSVTAWRDAALAAAALNGVRVVFSINILNGGAGFNMTSCPIPPTGGWGVDAGRCRMGPDQVRTYGTTLCSAGVGLFMWMYNADFMSKADNVQAFKDVATKCATLPTKSWRRP